MLMTVKFHTPNMLKFTVQNCITFEILICGMSFPDIKHLLTSMSIEPQIFRALLWFSRFGRFVILGKIVHVLGGEVSNDDNCVGVKYCVTISFLSSSK